MQLVVFKSKPLRWFSNSPDKFTRSPTAMHTIVYSLPASRRTGSLRYSNSLEPLRELETVRIKLVKDFIDEPMLVAKFPHPLPTSKWVLFQEQVCKLNFVCKSYRVSLGTQLNTVSYILLLLYLLLDILGLKQRYPLLLYSIQYYTIKYTKHNHL